MTSIPRITYRHGGKQVPVGARRKLPRQAQLGPGRGIENTPVGAHRAFLVLFPGLVEGFNNVVVIAAISGKIEKVAQEISFRCR